MKNYCITLSHRKDRRILAEKEFAEQGLDVEFYVAEKNKVRGWMGCRDSHIEVFKKAEQYSLITIFEDDVKFLCNYNEVIPLCLSQLPLDWDLLYLGLNPQTPMKRYSENLFIVDHAWCAHAIMYNNNGRVVDFILAHEKEIKKIDVFYSQIIHKQFKCFATYPMMCTQRVSKSDICYNTDVSQLERNYNKFITDAL